MHAQDGHGREGGQDAEVVFDVGVWFWEDRGGTRNTICMIAIAAAIAIAAVGMMAWLLSCIVVFVFVVGVDCNCSSRINVIFGD